MALPIACWMNYVAQVTKKEWKVRRVRTSLTFPRIVHVKVYSINHQKFYLHNLSQRPRCITWVGKRKNEHFSPSERWLQPYTKQSCPWLLRVVLWAIMEGPQIREISPLRAMFSARLAYPQWFQVVFSVILWIAVYYHCYHAAHVWGLPELTCRHLVFDIKDDWSPLSRVECFDGCLKDTVSLGGILVTVSGWLRLMKSWRPVQRLFPRGCLSTVLASRVGGTCSPPGCSCLRDTLLWSCRAAVAGFEARWLWARAVQDSFQRSMVGDLK